MPIYAVLSRQPDLFDRIAFTSALTSLHQAIPPRLLISSAAMTRRPWRPGPIAHRIAEEVLPEVESSEEHFGLLRYDRVDTARFLYEYLCVNPLRWLAPGSVDVQTLVVFGQADHLIGLQDAVTRRAYRQAFADRFRRVTFSMYDDTHFFASSRHVVNARLARFLASGERGEANGVEGKAGLSFEPARSEAYRPGPLFCLCPSVTVP